MVHKILQITQEYALFIAFLQKRISFLMHYPVEVGAIPYIWVLIHGKERYTFVHHLYQQYFLSYFTKIVKKQNSFSEHVVK